MNVSDLETTGLQEKSYFKIAFGLAVFTILYNLAEGLISTWFGYQDETLALFGFGVDSFIEMISGLGIAVMVTRIQKNAASQRSEFEKKALRITGASFYLLVAGLIVSSALTLYVKKIPITTFWGVVISIVSILVMLFLLRSKLRIGKYLHSDAILADANCTKVCIYMSCILLVSSGVYELTGFAYADAIGTLGLAWFSFKEGNECFEKAASEKYCGCEH